MAEKKCGKPKSEKMSSPKKKGGAAPASEEMKTKTYQKELRKLHVELVKLQEWVRYKGLKVCVVFEGA